ncbi:HhoA/HhoB/HtrA family serine endopeptidase [Geminocystis sp. GBBB08]|uniref:HhoA/HhoB/HtrA family serine endopeptidase n=1 Tax=Geminocystis sp. GBBB08 TaxID=2604140 RepID=UPI0027E2980A|nr:HhoA/HhoB/HtrA family serine endopeptidase [Geminocystis sp. GBBB08]MBL1209611.1 PDZ domain-containing protein [Geminocystis sp. GBBB08]
MRKYIQKATTCTSLLLLGAGIGVGVNYLVNTPQIFARTNENTTIQQKESLATAQLPQLENNANVNFVSKVVQEVGPAVVRINAERTVTNNNVPPAFNDPFFRQFFGNQIPQMPEEQIQQGTGSGFIISDDGKILTNAHVVEGSTKVTVNLKDGRVLDGKVLGVDSLTDLAVIQVKGENLPVAQLGDSDKLVIGEWAIAIGNPLGLDNTVTTGIISATGRSSSQIGVGDKRLDFIQTDAAINPGNSGGPLLNAQGEVIAINTAIIKNAQGLGFAIPINRAAEIAEKLILQGKVDHPYLGIAMIPLNEQTKQQLNQNEGFKLTNEEGVMVVKVIPNSPAAQAGLKSGDIIQSIEGEKIAEPSQVQKKVESSQVGSDLTLNLQRDRKEIKIPVKLGILPTNNQPQPQ